MDRIRTRALGDPSDPKARMVPMYHGGPFLSFTLSHHLHSWYSYKYYFPDPPGAVRLAMDAVAINSLSQKPRLPRAGISSPLGFANIPGYRVSQIVPKPFLLRHALPFLANARPNSALPFVHQPHFAPPHPALARPTLDLQAHCCRSWRDEILCGRWRGQVAGAGGGRRRRRKGRK
ncbi:hypothetical protein E2C01_045748 [Portunus trituberculatus]|uniref:Uncharacterized protein n=1 Tax=Portunus trituberculatus TaxID=210409 RepID=A0A5B7FVY7_PORTR|nr:hypothetical protein [Portunus trituberculatus]